MLTLSDRSIRTVARKALGLLRMLRPFFLDASPSRYAALARGVCSRILRIPAREKFSDQVDATTQLLDHASEFAARNRCILFWRTGYYWYRDGSIGHFHRAGGERGSVGVARYGRPAGPVSAQGRIISIKTEVKY